MQGNRKNTQHNHVSVIFKSWSTTDLYMTQDYTICKTLGQVYSRYVSQLMMTFAAVHMCIPAIQGVSTKMIHS